MIKLDPVLIYAPWPRYVVEIGEVEFCDKRLKSGEAVSIQTGISWEFHLAFEVLEDAMGYAQKLALENEFVRVIDRGERP